MNGRMNSSATINQVDEDFVHGQIKDSLADLILARCSDSFDRPACLDVLGNTRPVSWGQLLGTGGRSMRPFSPCFWKARLYS